MAHKRTILVSGSNTGIGFDLVKLLATKGHTVYLASRNETSGKEAQSVHCFSVPAAFSYLPAGRN